MKNELAYTQNLVLVTLVYNTKELGDKLFEFEIKNQVFSLRGFGSGGPAYIKGGKYSSTHTWRTGIYTKEKFELLKTYCEELGIDMVEEIEE